MPQKIELFYDFRSPYTYLAFSQLAKLNASIVLRPIQLLTVMKSVGNVPTTLTCKPKSRYANVDLGRWARRYGVALNPSDMGANDGDACSRAVLAAASPEQALLIADCLFQAIWGKAKTLSNAEEVITEIASAGLDTDAIALRFDSDDIRLALEANTNEAVERGVFGSPTMIVGDQMYFGNDRLDFLTEELARLEAVA